MTPQWHDGPLAALDWNGEAPVVWRAAADDAAARRDLTRALVARLARRRVEDVRLARTAAGAPRVAGPAGWYIGLSHRGTQCLIGAATRPIAVDRELVDDAPPLWDMLTEREGRDLRCLDPLGQPRAWLRRWTIKEAHAKLVGEPRRIAPETIETEVIDSVHATARYEGVSRCWTRDDAEAIETVALWQAAA
ncbi:MAG: 4'-phosphopantetheinyl transferase superfamily protein [Sphingomonas sp.]|jgi:4'-phosphopantetheinyl transferase|nr:MAG: 4'-phosphopantetheinyl transferase superfamily protein [Sphingomonas sp.]